MSLQSIQKLFVESETFPLDVEIEALATSPALSKETLRFVGSILQSYQPKSILEFGSGLSTRFLTSFMRASLPAAHLYTVEDSSYYLQDTVDSIYDDQNVTFLHSPIRNYIFRCKPFLTYDSDWVQRIPRNLKFDMVLIDGPPGRKFGREAPLYQIAPFITSQTLILLDDANRPQEQDSIANWERVFVDGVELVTFSELRGGFAVLRILNPTRKAFMPFSLRSLLGSWRGRLAAMNFQ